LEPATMPGRVVVQWDKEDCADLGLIKVDLLGLGMMAVLEDSIKLIRDAYHEEVDLAHLPQDDELVYAALQKADTIGMFQVESRAQMSCLPRSEEHTSELQSLAYLVCRLLLEKKKSTRPSLAPRLPLGRVLRNGFDTACA